MKNCVTVGRIVRVGRGSYDHPEFMGKMTRELTREIVMWAALFLDQHEPIGNIDIWLEPGANAVHFLDRALERNTPNAKKTYTLPEILPFCSVNILRVLKEGFVAYHDMGRVMFFQKYGFQAEVLRWRHQTWQAVENFKSNKNLEE